MPSISLPDNLMNEHMNWHRYPGRPDLGGRSIDPWGPGSNPPTPAPGSGREFLTFHQNFLAQFHAWYDSQSFADPSAVAPWPDIPDALKQVTSPPLDPGLVWSQDWANQEDQIVNNPLSFPSDDVLGMTIEWGLHAFLHNASGYAFNEQILLDPTTAPGSTYFYQLHGLIESWWVNWQHANAAAQPPAVTAQPIAPTEQPITARQFIMPHLHYELTGHNIHITYSLNSSSGKPELVYQGSAGNQTFTGDDIRSQVSELGTELTVTLKKTVDTGYTSLTLVLPGLNIGGKPQQQFRTLAIETIHLLGMPFIEKGVKALYHVHDLQGTAKIAFYMDKPAESKV